MRGAGWPVAVRLLCDDHEPSPGSVEQGRGMAVAALNTEEQPRATPGCSGAGSGAASGHAEHLAAATGRPLSRAAPTGRTGILGACLASSTPPRRSSTPSWRCRPCPPRGGNVMASSYQRYAGGAVTILLAAARSGASCVHAGAVGTGPERRPRPGCAGRRGGRAVLAAGDRRRHRRLRGARRAHRRAHPSSRPRGPSAGSPSSRSASSAPVAGDLVCVSGYSLVGRTRDPLLAWLDTLDPGVVVVLDPGAAFADLDPALRDRVLARTTSGPATPTRRRPSPGCTACTRPPRWSPPCCPRMP